jgi:hypothetical protein
MDQTPVGAFARTISVLHYALKQKCDFDAMQAMLSENDECAPVPKLLFQWLKVHWPSLTPDSLQKETRKYAHEIEIAFFSNLFIRTL